MWRCVSSMISSVRTYERGVRDCEQLLSRGISLESAWNGWIHVDSRRGRWLGHIVCVRAGFRCKVSWPDLLPELSFHKWPDILPRYLESLEVVRWYSDTLAPSVCGAYDATISIESFIMNNGTNFGRPAEQARTLSRDGYSPLPSQEKTGQTRRPDRHERIHSGDG